MKSKGSSGSSGTTKAAAPAIAPARWAPTTFRWHGIVEVSMHCYQKFLPEVINAAATNGPAMKQKYEKLVQEHLTKEEHLWQKGLKPEEAEALRKSYEQRYK